MRSKRLHFHNLAVDKCWCLAAIAPMIAGGSDEVPSGRSIASSIGLFSPTAGAKAGKPPAVSSRFADIEACQLTARRQIPVRNCNRVCVAPCSLVMSPVCVVPRFVKARYFEVAVIAPGVRISRPSLSCCTWLFHPAQSTGCGPPLKR